MKPIEIIRPYVRNGSFPLDKMSVFNSYKDAVEYAHNNPSAYPTQIIGVDNKETEQTAIYVTTYDPTKRYKLILEKIDLGYGSEIFNFKGSVEYYEDLPTEDVKQGDMWLVNRDSIESDNKAGMYIAFVDIGKNIRWEKVSIDIQYVSKTSDGLFRASDYATLFNETGSDALYFSHANNEPGKLNPLPNTNKWINVSHTLNEANIDYSIPSLGMVKQIIASINEKANPHIKLNVSTDMDGNNPLSRKLNLNEDYYPYINFVYDKELGGPIKRIVLSSKLTNSGSFDIDTQLAIFTQEDLATQNEKQFYLMVPFESQKLSSTKPESLTFTIEAEYFIADDNIIESKFCSDTITFNFCSEIQYGILLKKTIDGITQNSSEIIGKHLLHGDSDIKLSYNPKDWDAEINGIFIILPNDATLDSITYVQQHDTNAIDLFEKQELGDTVKYVYDLGNYSSLKNPGEFIFYVKDNKKITLKSRTINYY